MRKIYGSKFSSINKCAACAFGYLHMRYAIFLKKKEKRGGRVMLASIIRIYLLNDLYARALSIRLTPSAPNLMSPCAERGCSTFCFDITAEHSIRIVFGPI